jgi:hypothetical protein
VNDPHSLIPLSTPGHVSRRQAMQWVMAAVAASALPTDSFSQAAAVPGTEAQTLPLARGYGGDPNLVDVHRPGSIWPLTMTDAQKKTTRSLADVILPKDEYGPAASALGVPEMIDEWISAPYPQQQADRPVILDGLAWMDGEAARRFNAPFASLDDARKRAICDDICFPAAARREYKKAARFFNRFRSLAAAAYYATPAGWDAIGYVGNVPLTQFDGPPPAVLEKLGLS